MFLPNYLKIAPNLIVVLLFGNWLTPLKELTSDILQHKTYYYRSQLYNRLESTYLELVDITI